MPPNFEVSIDTRCLCERLRAVAPGETVEYAELSRLVGKNVQIQARHALYGAKKIVLRDNQIVFSVTPNVGLRRLSDVETIASARADIEMVIPRACKRIAKKASAISDFSALPPDKQVEHNASVAFLGTVALMAKPKHMKKLEAGVTAARQVTSFDATLALFKD